jgi:hypothetical protein
MLSGSLVTTTRGVDYPDKEGSCEDIEQVVVDGQ